MKMAPRGSRSNQRGSWGRWFGASGWLVLLAGCGLASNPQPPTLWLPEPVKDLAATRVGDAVHLHWTMPKETTDKVALKGDQRAHFCWEDAAMGEKPAGAGKAGAGKAQKATPKMGPDPCRALGDGLFPPEKAADFTVRMPGELVAGAPRAVAFFVELQNHAGKTAGPSNAAWVATGAAPPGVTGASPGDARGRRGAALGRGGCAGGDGAADTSDVGAGTGCREGKCGERGSSGGAAGAGSGFGQGGSGRGAGSRCCARSCVEVLGGAGDEGGDRPACDGDCGTAVGDGGHRCEGRVCAGGSSGSGGGG